METVPVDVNLRPWDALMSLFSGGSYNLSRFDDERFASRLNALLDDENFDIIHLESLFCASMLPVIRKRSRASVILRAHNVEHVIWQRLAQGESNPVKKAYLHVLAKRLKAEEARLLSMVDGIATITQEDSAALRSLGIKVPMQVIPMSLNIRDAEPQTIPEGPLSLYHLGSMNWQPNLEGVTWFVDEVWPLLHREIPSLSCHLAGRNMPSELLSHHAPPLHVEGEVDSLSRFTSGHAVALVPLLSGSGMRVKIVEAMAMGKVVISTTVGAEGIPYSIGENILIADTPHEFVNHLRSLSSAPETINSISVAARTLAEQYFDRKHVTAALTAFYDTLI